MILAPYVLLDGAGNRLVCLDARGGKIGAGAAIRASIAQRICSSDQGVGADSLLVLDQPEGSSPSVAAIHVYNADGSSAEMCGNGVRAVTMLLVESGEAPADRPFCLDTGAGPVETVYQGTAADGTAEVEVDMGVVDVGPDAVRTDGEHVEFGEGGSASIAVSDRGHRLSVHLAAIGNPHAVWLVQDTSCIDLARIGPKVEGHPAFPDRINLQAVQVMDSGRARLRTWERGAGETAACGSGACASAAVLFALGRAASPVAIEAPGGVLTITRTELGRMRMAGPARELARGEYRLPNAATG